MKNEAELQSDLEKMQRELLNLRCRSALGEEINPMDAKAARRDIARIRTILRERELGLQESTVSGGQS
jgi:large subunit ribosomal protein L29